MLQQTQVATVVPYYQRFLRRFPDVATLARADLPDLLQVWSGLGYYRRASLLLRAARTVMREHGGRIPSDPLTLRSLPGIGLYTAPAIASIAYGLPVAVVDGNVRRVICRLCALRSQPIPRQLALLAQQLLHTRDPGVHNEAMMELGATLCTPRAPSCERCPLRRSCEAYRLGITSRIPRPLPRPKVSDVSLVAVVALRTDRVLLAKRRPTGLYAGLWEPPMFESPTSKPVHWLGAALFRIERGVICELWVLGDLAGLDHVLEHNKAG